MKLVLLALSISIGSVLFAQDSTLTLMEERIPEWARKVLNNSEIMTNYEVIDSVNPFYLEADFTGDDLADIVFMVKSKSTNQMGVSIVNRGDNKIFIFGAGKPVGMGTNISWCDKWYVYREKHIYNFSDRKKKFYIKHPGIEIVKNEKSSIVIYWDRRRYKTHIKYI